MNFPQRLWLSTPLHWVRWAGLAILVAVGVMNGPTWIVAAAANTFADPTPRIHVPQWQGDPQKFADGVRDSVGEVRGILAHYSRKARSAGAARLPHLIVQDKPSCQLFMEGPVSYCKDFGSVYINREAALAMISQKNAGAFVALVADQLFGPLANFDPSRTICLVGAWLGYVSLENWQRIDHRLAQQVQASATTQYPQAFNQGFNTRSFDACLAP